MRCAGIPPPGCCSPHADAEGRQRTAGHAGACRRALLRGRQARPVRHGRTRRRRVRQRGGAGRVHDPGARGPAFQRDHRPPGGPSVLVLLERGNDHDIEAWGAQLVARIARNVVAVGEKSVSITCSVGMQRGAEPAGRRRRRHRRCARRLRQGAARGGNQVTHLGPVRQRHPRQGLRPGVGQAHQGRPDGEPLPAGAAAHREPAGRGSGHVRRAGAHDRRERQGGAAR